MATKLHLRRIMYNDGPASTSETSEEELLHTFISLQDGKSFGRGAENGVIFVEDAQLQGKGSLMISRKHAEVVHRQQTGNDQYLVVDLSENGTYVNDLRLIKDKGQLLQAGDLIKFGHKNAAAIQPGAPALQPHADWTFRVEVPSPSQAEIRQSAVRIFSNTPVVENMERGKQPIDSGRATARSRVVQQREADSTNQELVEPQLFGTGTSGHDRPSTSQSDTEYDARYMMIADKVYEKMISADFQAKLNDAAGVLTASFPGLPPTVMETIRKIDLSQAATRQAKVMLIENVLKQAQTVPTKPPAFANVGRRHADNVAVVDADSSGDVLLPPSYPHGVSVSAFRPAPLAAVLPHLAQPQPKNPVVSDAEFRKYLNDIHVTNQFLQHITELSESLQLSLVEAARVAIKPSIGDVLAMIAARASPLMYSLAAPFCLPLNGGVIRSTNEAIALDCADENRHSASSGSTSHSNVRRRTESEESEILDVVGTDDPEDVEENDENEDPNHVHHFEYEAASTDDEAVEENLTVGGTQTPSPMLSENIQQASHALAVRNVREAAEILRDEPLSLSTTSTAVASPMSSPPSVPLENETPGLPDHEEELGEIVELQLNDQNHQEEEKVEEEKEVIAENETMALEEKEEEEKEQEQVKKDKDDDKEDDKEEEKDEGREEEEEEEEKEKEVKEDEAAARKAEELQKKEEARVKKEKLKEKRKAAAERKRKVVEAAEQARAKKVESIKEKSRDSRKMKQLDSENSDSDADDAESDKRTVRRSTRGKATTSTEEPPVAVENEDDDSDAPVVDSPESRKLKRKRNQKAKAPVRKNAKATTSEEPPTKKRVEEKDSTDADNDDSNPKNRCGVSEKYCLSPIVPLEEKEKLEWVQCETDGCGQWFHSFCISLDNYKYATKRAYRFYCCGRKKCKEATRGRNGDVFREYEELPDEEVPPS